MAIALRSTAMFSAIAPMYLALASLIAIAQLSCDNVERNSSISGPVASAIKPTPAKASAPSFETASEAVSYEEGNRHRWIELEVTAINRGDEALAIDWRQLLAEAGCVAPTPVWSIKDLPRVLQAQQQITARASWTCQPPFDKKAPLPRQLRIRYRQRGATTFEKVVPVRMLATKGIIPRFDSPASARSFTEPLPAKGEGWDVCTTGVASNSGPQPIVYTPIFRATVVEPKGSGGMANGWLGQRITRLDPGASISGKACWRFRGPSGQPRPKRIVIEHSVAPAVAQEIDVR